MSEPQLLIEVIEFIKGQNRHFYTQTHKGKSITLQQFIADLEASKADYEVKGPIYDPDSGIKTHIFYVICKVHSNTPAAAHFVPPEAVSKNGGQKIKTPAIEPTKEK